MTDENQSSEQATQARGRDEAPAPAVARAETPEKPRGKEKPQGEQKPKQPVFETSCSRNFVGWLNEQRVSIAFTTYQASKLFFVGLQPKGALALHKRTLPRCMGMLVKGNSLFVSSLYQLWRFENQLASGQVHQGHDRLYVPKVGFVTGDLDVHDIAVDERGRVLFVNTLFSCLATVSPAHSFVPIWKPPFISKLAAEDRCHLNGLAMKDGRPAWMTAVAEADATDSWREHRRDGGCVIDVQTNEIVVRGLSMPHSPRWHRGRLWLHDSGTGHFGYVDFREQKFVPVCFCPGYLRGLDFAGDFAVVGLSKPRHTERGPFGGLALQQNLEKKKSAPRCAVFVIDLRTGDAVQWLRMEGAVQELYDVAVIPNCRRPMAIGFQTDEVRRVISMGRPGQAPTLHVLPRKEEDQAKSAPQPQEASAEAASPQPGEQAGRASD